MQPQVLSSFLWCLLCCNSCGGGSRSGFGRVNLTPCFRESLQSTVLKSLLAGLKCISLSLFSGSGSQDIRNTIPFSGKGFLLGGKSQPPTPSSPSRTPAVPPSPKRLFAPPSPAKSLGSPVRSGLDGKGLCGTSAGLKRPVKRSVANIRAFVNINGSPVRIPKPHSGGRGADPLKQKSIGELFISQSIGRPAGQSSSSSSSNTDTQKESLTSPNSHASSVFPKQRDNSSASAPTAWKPGPSQSSRSVVSAKPIGGPAKPAQAKCFSHSNSDGTSGQASRKRPWDDHRSSASIADFFQKTSGSDSAASSESTTTKSPATQQRAAAASSSSSSSSPRSSAGLPGFTRPSSSSPSSSAPTVSCPVCQAEVQESKINGHLDSCLS